MNPSEKMKKKNEGKIKKNGFLDVLLKSTKKK